MKNNAREHSFKCLINELVEAGFEISGEEHLKKKIKNLKDAYRNEINKVKKSMKSGAGTDDVYKPKLVWSEKVDAFWRNVISGRESSSNLVSRKSLKVHNNFHSFGLGLSPPPLDLYIPYRLMGLHLFSVGANHARNYK